MMKTTLLAAAILGFGFVGQVVAQDSILIAVAGPMTGNNAVFGAQLKAGAEAAVADINAGGGVLGKPLSLKIADDACYPEQAVDVAKKLAEQGIKFMAGHFCSDASIQSASVYAEQGVLMISPASTSPQFSDKRPGPNIFRVSGRDDQQGTVAGKYIAEYFKDKNVAILHDKTAYGKGLAEETRKAMNEAGKKEMLFDSYTAGERDYAAVVSKLKQADIGLVYIGGYHSEAGLILRQMRAQGMKDTTLMGGDALITQEYWQITGDDGAGTLMTFSPDPRKNPAAAEVVERFREEGFEPEGYVLYSYAAVQVFKQAAEKAGSTDMDKLVKSMSDTEFDTVIGKFTFDEKGDPSLPPYTVYVWKDGDYEQLPQQ